MNEKIKKTAIKANNILTKTVFLFLFLIPIIGILQVSGISDNSMEELLFCMGLILVLSVVPSIFNKISYHEETIAMVTLLSIEIIFLLLSLNPYAELSIFYILTLVISLIYCNQRLTQRISLLSYVGMIGAYLYRMSLTGDLETNLYYNETLYISLLTLTLEFLAAAVVASYGAGFFENLVLSSESTDFSLTNQADGALQSGAERQEGKPIEECVYDIQTLFHGIEQDLLALIKGKDKSFEMELDANLPVKLYGAKEEIRQALSDICSDFLMYHAEAAIKMYVTYDSGINPKKRQNITLIIRISGHTDITSVTANKTALGYYLSQRIIGKLKGSFEDLSDSQDMMIRISLLQRVEDETTIAKRKQQKLQELHQVRSEVEGKGITTFFKSQIKVLIVDDNRENCKLIDAILNSMGVQVVCTDNGAKAIEMLQSQDYQMVFMDQMMPDKSGGETVKEIRYIEDEYFRQLPIILMTLNAKEDAKKEYEELGFTDSISKPIKAAEVKACLQRWIKEEYPLTYAEYKKMMEE